MSEAEDYENSHSFEKGRADAIKKSDMDGWLEALKFAMEHGGIDLDRHEARELYILLKSQ